MSSKVIWCARLLLKHQIVTLTLVNPTFLFAASQLSRKWTFGVGRRGEVLVLVRWIMEFWLSTQFCTDGDNHGSRHREIYWRWMRIKQLHLLSLQNGSAQFCIGLYIWCMCLIDKFPKMYQFFKFHSSVIDWMYLWGIPWHDWGCGEWWNIWRSYCNLCNLVNLISQAQK